MILIHVFSATTGERQTVVLPGTDRSEARRFCRELVESDNGVYRAGIWDAMSERLMFDTDASWYVPAPEMVLA